MTSFSNLLHIHNSRQIPTVCRKTCARALSVPRRSVHGIPRGMNRFSDNCTRKERSCLSMSCDTNLDTNISNKIVRSFLYTYKPTNILYPHILK